MREFDTPSYDGDVQDSTGFPGPLATLEPGEYELACTVVEVVGDEAIGHYAKGMRTPFTVTG